MSIILIPVTQVAPPVTPTASQFQAQGEIPPEFKWSANLPSLNTPGAD
jgi:hypothetical protein